MTVFSHVEHDDHEQIVYCSDRASGLKAIIAIHNTRLGPALGGCRIYPYFDEKDALEDVLRLSRGMTSKAALAGLELGGGKSVIIADPDKDKTPAMMAAFGKAVHRLAGRYIVAEDVGSTVADMEIVRKMTPHVGGLPGSGGDPSPSTARGVLQGIKAAILHKTGKTSLAGLTVAIQGLGHVGFSLAEMLAAEGVSLKVADIRRDNPEKARAKWGATILDTDAIHAAEADIFAPCALGAILNDTSIPELKAGIIAGSANNQLARPEHGDALHKRGILYAPDFAINAGGLINVACGLESAGGYKEAKAREKIDALYDTMLTIFRKADAENITTASAADALALERLEPGNSATKTAA